MHYDEFLRQVAGDLDLAWRKYRRRKARRAVHARMEELGLGDLSDYLRAIRADPEEARALPDRMRVTVTRFLRERGFAREGPPWKVREAVRAPVTFARYNLLEDPPPAAMDLALCRYLAFTCYRGARRTRAVRRLHGSLRPGGGLVIGRKEGPSPADPELFEPWPEVPGVFRRRDEAPTASG
jgi:chemotaxis methyl-accepting protein methylase